MNWRRSKECDGETRDCDAACYRCGLGLTYSPPVGQNTASAGAHGDHLIRYILDRVEPRADGGGIDASADGGEVLPEVLDGVRGGVGGAAGLLIWCHELESICRVGAIGP